MMNTSDELTFIPKYASPHTRTALAQLERARIVDPNDKRKIHVTTVEDGSIQEIATCWRVKNDEEGDLLIVEVELVEKISRFELPFSHAVHFADEAQP
ncbi:hypothetical protein [Pseudogulbenkiania subflava]|uniref:Uncharacterized protein n=1 Tax=Pseudogulbenkiania subflava DSM 22618 TaxID=1123014 RepID=A0A1Y6BDC2_9NEIS|nr:hypothetical protein [Pseudogulbenkiania subflava]SMF04006.1 hypothetical protein SAMN02745746_00917 [Pseudogulbenkiania subflava DSM 22618]